MKDLQKNYPNLARNLQFQSKMLWKSSKVIEQGGGGGGTSEGL
jgi:hypothetical protein